MFIKNQGGTPKFNTILNYLMTWQHPPLKFSSKSQFKPEESKQNKTKQKRILVFSIYISSSSSSSWITWFARTLQILHTSFYLNHSHWFLYLTISYLFFWFLLYFSTISWRFISFAIWSPGSEATPSTWPTAPPPSSTNPSLPSVMSSTAGQTFNFSIRTFNLCCSFCLIHETPRDVFEKNCEIQEPLWQLTD